VAPTRLPPALAAQSTTEVLALLGEPPARVLELGFAGIHATPLRLAGFDVTVAEPDPAYRERARERAGDVLAAPPPERFDAVVAPVGADLGKATAGKLILVAADGAASIAE
jgi:hypothetical protein